ncbi:uncharacterized protein LOC121872213 [Homarus americanus]|uniref:Transcription factor Adf-1-like 1 n=1 Tax=Homarus americanus TaxID=6706 RepID=A0A8J5K319_HOMAM|nr:uncharacterized protein LOC121872213 [Homarus americanus]KAG7164019.1 Transcription factor Adf-1-like 1 [Homarus americanus]
MQVDVLINLVRERPAIYDPTDRSHRDRDVIAALWREVAAALKCKEAECKEKWQHLRSNFMREKRKISAKPSGSADIQSKKWVYYDAMEFLIPHVTPRPTSSNISTPPDEDTSYDAEDTSHNASCSTILDAPDNSSYQEAASNVDNCEVRSTVMPTLPMSKKPKVTKKRCSNNADDMDMRFLEELKKMREQTCSTDDNDPDRLFLLSLLPMMKQLSPADNIDIKIEIHEAFRRKLFPPVRSVPYDYWNEQDQSHAPSPCTTSNASDNYSEYSNL